MNKAAMDKLVFFEGKKLRPELLDQDARRWAGCLVLSEDKTDKKGKSFVNYHGVSRHQLRRLYDEVKHYQKLLEDKKKLYPKEKDRGWDEVKPLVKMVRAKTAYMVARMKDKEKNFKTKAAYDSLYNFIDQSLNLIDEESHFNAFCLFFEAVYGFYYHLGGASTK
ncbi:MAG: type III-A CRISPR-associated protein Csm2 [Deltaproteobacteria bacterium]|nr:type III-A CRISPR-associated protein Csm2 [Deltaproteobacteria bacterium]